MPRKEAPSFSMFGQAGALDSAHGRLRFGGSKLETTATLVGNLKSMLSVVPSASA